MWNISLSRFDNCCECVFKNFFVLIMPLQFLKKEIITLELNQSYMLFGMREALFYFSESQSVYD